MFAMYSLLKKPNQSPSRATRAHWAALISVSVALSQTPAEGHGASVSRGVPF